MKQTVLIIFTVLLSGTLLAQDFQGVATYKSHRKLDIKLDSTQVDSGMKEMVMAQLKKQFEKTYILTFNKEASIYKEDEQLSAPQPSGMQVVMINTGGSDVLYKNTKEKRFVNQNESFSKLFLIKDSLKTFDWKLTGETKNIGEYTCYKATLKREREVIKTSFSFNGNESEKEDENEAPEMEEYITTAWYTTQIPVNNGPGNYYGLPGLILEVNNGRETLICSKIVLNPKKKIEIVEPKKGKEITQEKYDAIIDKKIKEMNEQFSRKDRDGNNFSISIGG
ncbi:GLPGLI family protein [Pontimicrobium sp. MEBiC01747]